jgi:hypothetical protein
MAQFDFLEGFNACEDGESNGRAMQIAREHHLPMFGGSDAHKVRCVGLGCTEFAGKVTCESELIRLLKERGEMAAVCGGEYYHGTTRQKMGKIDGILSMSFWVYNHLGSMWRRHGRSAELKKMG